MLRRQKTFLKLRLSPTSGCRLQAEGPEHGLIDYLDSKRSAMLIDRRRTR